MPTRDLFAGGLKLLGRAKVTINSATTSNFDFGTPDDINLATVTANAPGLNFEHEDRILVVFAATTTGTTDTVSFSVQDAADNGSGAIGTPAAAVTDGTLTGGTGTQYAYTSVRVQSGRPWLRCRITSTGATDTFVGTVHVFALPHGL